MKSKGFIKIIRIKDDMQDRSMRHIVLALLNSMVGAILLVLPVISLPVSAISIATVCVLAGAVTTYISVVLVRHLGTAPTFRQALFHHFNSQVPARLHALVLWLQTILLLGTQFRMLALTLSALTGWEEAAVNWATLALTTCATALFRHCELQQYALAFGSISILVYLLFIMWVVLQEVVRPRNAGNFYQQQQSPFQVIKFTAILLHAYSLHGLLIPVLTKHHSRHQYPKIIKCTFAAGGVIYLFSCLSSQSLKYHIPWQPHPQIITHFLHSSLTFVTILHLTAALHLATLSPILLIDSLKKFTFFLDISFEDPSWGRLCCQFVYLIVMNLLSLAVHLSYFSLDHLLHAQGAIFGFTTVIATPALLHLWCIGSGQSGRIEGEHLWNSGIRVNQCRCNVEYSSAWGMCAQICLVTLTLLLGGFIMLYSVWYELTNSNDLPA